MSSLICPPRFQISILKSKLSMLLINQRGLQIGPNRGGGLRIGPQSKVTDDLPRNYFQLFCSFLRVAMGRWLLRLTVISFDCCHQKFFAVNFFYKYRLAFVNFFALQLYFFCRLTAIETLFPYVNTSHGVSTL